MLLLAQCYCVAQCLPFFQQHLSHASSQHGQQAYFQVPLNQNQTVIDVCIWHAIDQFGDPDHVASSRAREHAMGVSYYGPGKPQHPSPHNPHHPRTNLRQLLL